MVIALCHGGLIQYIKLALADRSTVEIPSRGAAKTEPPVIMISATRVSGSSVNNCGPSSATSCQRLCLRSNVNPWAYPIAVNVGNTKRVEEAASQVK